jgi:hypothetical protein
MCVGGREGGRERGGGESDMSVGEGKQGEERSGWVRKEGCNYIPSDMLSIYATP